MKRVFLLLLMVFCSSVQAQPSLAELKVSAAEGDPWAQLNLGAAYDNAYAGAAKNPVLAVTWYRRAAKQGLAKAQFNLAHCLGSGYGAVQDYVESRHWMLLAAQQGMADAQYLLGVMLAQGLGGRVDNVSAKQWLRKAANGGNDNAREYLKTL